MTDSSPIRALLFDVNETLLDIRPLARLFEDWFGDGQAMRLWFAHLVMHAQSVTLAGGYVDFGTLAKAVLTMQAAASGVTLPCAAGERLVEAVTHLQPHEDVRPALERLCAAGYVLAALTNGSPDALETQMAQAGLADLIEHRMSVAATRAYKPAPAPYACAARRLGLPIAQIMLVACHGWDTLGGHAAGCHTAFVQRPDSALIAIEGMTVAQWSVPDLTALADRLCAAADT